MVDNQKLSLHFDRKNCDCIEKQRLKTLRLLLMNKSIEIPLNRHYFLLSTFKTMNNLVKDCIIY